MNKLKLKHELNGSSGVPEKWFGKNWVKEMNQAMNVSLNKKGLRAGKGWKSHLKKKIGESK